VFNLHGSAVNNAAACVRADDAARDARDSAADAVAHAAAPPTPWPPGNRSLLIAHAEDAKGV